MRWFSHRRRTVGRDDKTALLIYWLELKIIHQTYTARKRPKTAPGSHETGPSAAAARWLQRAHAMRTHPGVSASEFLSLATLTFDFDIRTRTRFLYNAPNRQVSSSHV